MSVGSSTVGKDQAVAFESLKKIRKGLEEIQYYFFRLPLCGLTRPDLAYQKVETLWKANENEKQIKVAQQMKSVLGERLGDQEIRRLSKRYLEILRCDDLDAWLWLLNPWEKIKGHLRVEGEEHFREVVRQGKGCFLLSTHFGGAFFVFDLVRNLGGKPQGFGQPIRRDKFKNEFFRWAYLKFRLFCVNRAVREEIIYSGRRETKREVLEKLRNGYHIVVFFDVPPLLTVGKTEKVTFLGRTWNFPRGFLKMVVGQNIPVVPFFSYLADDQTRTFCF